MDLQKADAHGKIQNKIDQQKRENLSLLWANELRLVFTMFITSNKQLTDQSFAQNYLQISY